MKYILLPDSCRGRKLPFYFAVEEYVATHYTDDEYFFVWQVGDTVMLGRNQLLHNEVDLSYCRKHNIDVFRRKSGGGCVFADKGCLQFSYVVNSGNVNDTFHRYMQATVDVLRRAGVEAQLSGRNDVLVDGRKVAGAAFYRTGSRSVMHNTLLYNTDLGRLSSALHPVATKLESKGIASVSQRVGNVGEHTTMDMKDFVALSREMMCGTETLVLSEDDFRHISEIEQRLASDEFVYGSSPRYTVSRRLRLPEVGCLEAFVELKGSKVVSMNIVGDYFLIGDIDRELIARLLHVDFSREAVAAALEGVDLSAIVRNLTSEGLLRLLFGAERRTTKPQWLKTKLITNETFKATSRVIEEHGLHTICQSGLCPNRAECWRNGTATFMIGGDVCTRSCRFCATRSGRPLPLDENEPSQVAASVRLMDLRYVVLTSVDRDDLPDGGAAHWAKTVSAVRQACPATRIETLIPDFGGRTECIDTVLDARPDVVGHNMETVRRLTPTTRSVARYDTSLEVLRHVASRLATCKSGFMVGLGETEAEVVELMGDLRAVGCEALTIGQYLQPSARHLPVVEYVDPSQFRRYRELALDMGFRYVESGPLVRSSYHAENINRMLREKEEHAQNEAQ